MLASAISIHGGYSITIYHTFHDEVDSYRTHVWQCNGPCKDQAPYYGLVKRSMNRPPSKSDSWWKKHEEACGGTYMKIAEPELTKDQIRAMSAKDRAGRQKNKIDSWLGAASSPRTTAAPTLDIKQTIDGSRDSRIKDGPDSRKRCRSMELDADVLEPLNKSVLVSCPICEKPIPERDINEHLDTEHP